MRLRVALLSVGLGMGCGRYAQLQVAGIELLGQALPLAMALLPAHLVNMMQDT